MSINAFNVKVYTVLTCGDCGLEKMKIRARKDSTGIYAKCNRCYGINFAEKKISGIREMCANCHQLVIVEWNKYEAWKAAARCWACGWKEVVARKRTEEKARSLDTNKS